MKATGTNEQRYAFSDLQDILEVGNQMGNIRRYSRDFMVKPENVLEHVGFAAFFCFVVGNRINESGQHLVDMGELLSRAVVHDLEETLTGDVARPTKYSRRSVKKGLDAFGEKAVNHIQKVLGTEMRSLWLEAKDDSIEGRILKMADWASVLVKCMTEIVHYNNHAFIRVLDELATSKEDFLLLADGYQELSYFTTALVQLLNTIEDHVADPVKNRMEINQWLGFFEVI